MVPDHVSEAVNQYLLILPFLSQAPGAIPYQVATRRAHPAPGSSQSQSQMRSAPVRRRLAPQARCSERGCRVYPPRGMDGARLPANSRMIAVRLLVMRRAVVRSRAMRLGTCPWIGRKAGSQRPGEILIELANDAKLRGWNAVGTQEVVPRGLEVPGPRGRLRAVPEHGVDFILSKLVPGGFWHWCKFSLCRLSGGRVHFI